MRTEVKEVKIFKYEELSVEAKDKVMDDYLQDNWNIMLEDAELCVIDRLDNLLPNSDLKIQFDDAISSWYSEINIYGKLNLIDLVEKIEDLETDERKTLKDIINEMDNHKIELSYNHCGTYLDMNYTDICKFMDDELNQYEETEKLFEDNISLIDKFSREGCRYMEMLSKMHYSTLKDMLDIDNIDMEELSDINGWEYLENGEFYVG